LKTGIGFEKASDYDYIMWAMAGDEIINIPNEIKVILKSLAHLKSIVDFLSSIGCANSKERIISCNSAGFTFGNTLKELKPVHIVAEVFRGHTVESSPSKI